jgi:hypothetical protein
MELQPTSLGEAKEYIKRHHRHHKEMLRRIRQVDDLKALLAAAKAALCKTCPATCRLPECFCTIVPEIDAALEAPHA